MRLRIERASEFLLFDLSIRETSLKGVWYLCVLYLGTILLAVGVSPWIYWGMQLWRDWFPNDLNRYLCGKDFIDYFERVRWIAVLVFLPWLLRACRVGSLKRLGVCWEWKAFWRYGLFGIGMLILLSLAQGFAGKVTFTGGRLASLVNFVLAGLILGFVEEVLFRGIVLRLFYSATKTPLVAAVLSALLFAYTHFKAPVGGHVGQVLWNSAVPAGMQTVWGIFQSFDCVLFMNLFGLGLFLNLLFLRKRTLIPCIAFHAGIVFAMLAYKRFFRIEVIDWKAFLGSNRVTDAWFVFVVWVIGISILMFKLGKDGREKVELG